MSERLVIRTTAARNLFFSRNGTSEICPLSTKSSPLRSLLAIREDRGIRRRLPTASLSLLPPTPGITSDVSSDAPSTVSTTITAAAASASASASSAQPQPQPQPTPPSPSAAPPADFLSNDYLSLSTSPAPPHPRPRSANHISSDPRLRRLASPSLQLQPSARSARDPPGKDVPRVRSSPLQLGLRRQRGLLRVHTATRRRAPLRRSHPRFRPRRRARARRASHHASVARSHITMCARSGKNVWRSWRARVACL